jgi:molecular chaperone HscB
MGIPGQSTLCQVFLSPANAIFQDKTQAARDLSGLVNEAYNTLLQPLSRIHYILSQHNLSVSETDQLDDPRLITEVIEIREALEDASSESEVEEIKKDVSGSRETILSMSTIN